jgi:acyl-CoA-binding protein
MATSSSSSSATVHQPPPSAATFRAKTNYMKAWRPRSPPSNRDRLELYALHKQAVSGDAPPLDSSSHQSSQSLSAADKAKSSAWRSKRGLGKVEAMTNYVEECDRQLRVYGESVAASGMRGGETSASSSSPSSSHHHGATTTTNESERESSTPQNTPAWGKQSTGGQSTTHNDNNNNNTNNEAATNNDTTANNNNGALLCPRGLAAIPLLCAAASESRSAYLARLQVTHPSNGWWAKQEPLCLEPTNPLSIPERLILGSASKIEQLSLIVSNYMGTGHAVSILSPRVLQAFLWPVHNVFLCSWITLILTTTYLGSMVVMVQTLLFGAKRTNAPLGRLFVEEIHPAALAVELLCEEHQVIGVRVSGLALMPLMMLCDVATSIMGRVGILLGSFVFVGMGVCSWWYWLCVLPWLAVCGLCLAVMSGWCFGLIELAGN